MTHNGLEIIYKIIRERARLNSLSNRELVAEVVDHPDDLPNYLHVSEMMSRLDPEWASEVRITERETE